MNKASGRNELRVEKVRAEALAEDPEGRIADIFHRREEDRSFAKLYLANSHAFVIVWSWTRPNKSFEMSVVRIIVNFRRVSERHSTFR